MQDWVTLLAQETVAKGANAVAKRLGVPRQAVLAVVAGIARKGTIVVVKQQWHASNKG